MRTITVDDAGKQIVLKVGELCAVVLAGNPTTGYQWEVVSLDASIVKQVGAARYEPSGASMGGGGQFTFQFRAMTPGQMPLKLIYQRPFEKDTPPAQIYEVTLIVQ